ncbi:MAG: O-antigen ligase family protein, partial [Firmicutes bacterium]|nr:O-antigen ligase family protein [Bacillota bacterium]
FIFADYFKPVIDWVTDPSTGDRGRWALWDSALAHFRGGNWFFGRGFFYGSALAHDVPDKPFMLNYHNQFLQALSNLGVIGLIFFSVHFFQRYFYLIKKRTAFSASALFAILFMDGYGLVDVTYFALYYLAPMLIIFLMSEASFRDKGNEAFKLNADFERFVRGKLRA